MLDFACTAECVEGCFCPPDLVEYGDGCVSSVDCPTETLGESLAMNMVIQGMCCLKFDSKQVTVMNGF